MTKQPAQKVVVSGACGFIGRAVTRALAARGYAVLGVDTQPAPADAATFPAVVEWRQLDLTREANSVFAEADSCVHLAALIGGIGYFHAYPADILSENSRLNSQVFSAAARHRLKRIVYISSSMVYERVSAFPSREEDLRSCPPPESAYGFSKLSGEYYCRAFRQQYGLPYTIVRPFNAYGPGELPGAAVGAAHVIPDLVTKILGGQDPVEILGDGQQVRCFTYVDDIAEAVALTLENPAAADEDFNISSDQPISILELAQRIFALVRPGAALRTRFLPSFEYDTRHRIPDVRKARERLGWSARVKLDDGLRITVHWLREQAVQKQKATR